MVVESDVWISVILVEVNGGEDQVRQGSGQKWFQWNELVAILVMGLVVEDDTWCRIREAG